MAQQSDRDFVGQPPTSQSPAARIAAGHRKECDALRTQAMEHGSFEDILSGVVTSTNKSTIGIGLAKLVVERENKSYRAREALLADPSEPLVEGVEWVTIQSNTSLRHLLEKYGDRLLAYESTRNDVTFEFLSIDVLDSTACCVRILLRRT